MESDDRVVGVVKQVDDALAELDKMDLMIGLYKTQLNVRIIPHFCFSFFSLPVRSQGRRFS